MRSLIVLVGIVLIALAASPIPFVAATFGTKIEAGGRECYSEIVEAGGTLGFNFRVTDGGSFNIDVVVTTTYTPAFDSVNRMMLVHYTDYYREIRDQQRTEVLNTWSRATEGSLTYTAPKVEESKHGLPAEITICFDNSFSLFSPKWVSFSIIKYDVFEVDPNTVRKVDVEMEETLHHYGKVMFNLAKDADGMRLAGDADRIKNRSTTSLIGLGLTINILVIVVLSIFQYNALTRFMKQMQQQCLTNSLRVIAE
ncbi:unnamed protein product [Phytomonas sp. EM1]|nr:unnamed protein product [Phytomonas sp. EM1]|eukprot:CCW65440.1 unnamed protein product [Phytomonas sp. isolate EM1]